MNTDFKWVLFSISLIILYNSAESNAQQNNKHGFYYPVRYNTGEYSSILIMGLAKLPEDAVEEVNSLIYAPLFTYNGRLGLPAGFSVTGGLSTNIITYHLSLSPEWTLNFNRFSFSVHYALAYWFGALNHFGFQSKVRGWFAYPGLSFGFAFNKFSVSLKTELSTLLKLYELIDEVEVSFDYKFLAGISSMLLIEQQLWKDNIVSLGIKINYTKFYYPAWAVYPTWNRYNFIPEVIIGLNF